MHEITLALCDDLNTYLMKQYGYKRKPASVGLSFNIDARRKYFDLYLRCPVVSDYWPNMTLVIARIYFKNTRNGEGTKLLEMLANSAVKLGLSSIAIETANINSSKFALSLGFKKYKSENNGLVNARKIKSNLCLNDNHS